MSVKNLLSKNRYHYHGKVIFKEPRFGSGIKITDIGTITYDSLAAKLISCVIIFDNTDVDDSSLRLYSDYHPSGS